MKSNKREFQPLSPVEERWLAQVLPGNCIVLEGPDAVGKTTTQKAFMEWINAVLGIVAVKFSTPGDKRNIAGPTFRDMLLNNPVKFNDPFTREYLFVADIQELISGCVIPAMNDKLVVVMDRFLLSTEVYAEYGDGFKRKRIMDLINTVKIPGNDGEAYNHRVPSLTFFLNADPDTLRKRRGVKIDAGGEDVNYMDHLADEFHQKIHKGYLECIKGRNHIIQIDANPDLEEVLQYLQVATYIFYCGYRSDQDVKFMDSMKVVDQYAGITPDLQQKFYKSQEEYIG